MIILKRKFVDVELPSGVGLSGEYKLVVSDAQGNVKRETDWFPNIILDQGLNNLGYGTSGIGGCAIGTGTATPAATQTTLQTQSAWTTSLATASISSAGASPWWTGFTWGYRFNIGTLNGNYSEIGVGLSNGTNLFSRALILDGGGSPTTITVGSTEQLDVYYTRRVYPPLSDVVTTPTISGVSTTVTTRAMSAGQESGWWQAGSFPYPFSQAWAYNGAIGVLTGFPSGTGASMGGFGMNSYSNNSYTLGFGVSVPTDGGNVAGGISAAYFGMTMCSFQYGFSPAIAKDATKTMVLNVSCSWGRRP